MGQILRNFTVSQKTRFFSLKKNSLGKTLWIINGLWKKTFYWRLWSRFYIFKEKTPFIWFFIISLRKHKSDPKFKPSWLKISNEFNEFPFISQIRTPAHCQERWKNTLKTEYHRGNWNAKDDEKILDFVMKFGTKWSKLAKMFNGRTEHNIKNRFFSILSRELEKPIREIKRKINYRSQKVLGKVKSMVAKTNLWRD